MKAYLAIKYHPDNRNRDAIENLTRVLRQQGVSAICMARDYECWGEKEFSASELMRKTFQEIDTSDFVAIEFSEKGVGLGIEAGYAFSKDKPILLLVKEGSDISKTMQGVSTDIQKYTTCEDINLDKFLEKIQGVRKTLLVFTEGTILMHKTGLNCSRDEIVSQVMDEERSVKEYSSYVPVGGAVEKLRHWERAGMRIIYLTSRTKEDEISAIRTVLERNGFPNGDLFFRKSGETYVDVVERANPDVLIEDDCESIGGEKEMISSNLSKESCSRIRCIIVSEFSGIDSLPVSLY